MAHWFGGESVPTLGIAGVGVDPAARGKGLALRLMQACLRDAREAGVALSSLYPRPSRFIEPPATKLGGHHFRWSVRPADCPRVKNGLELLADPPRGRSRDRGDLPLLRAHPGGLSGSRCVRVEPRARAPMGERARLRRARRARGGGLRLTSRSKATWPRLQNASSSRTWSRSHPPRSPRSSRCSSSTARWSSACGGKARPATRTCTRFPEKVFSIEMKSFWMLRIVHASGRSPSAVIRRSIWTSSCASRTTSLRENTGTYRARAEGRAEPSVEVMPESLVLPADAELGACARRVALHRLHDAERAREGGLLRAGAATQQKLALLFGGPTPALADFFWRRRHADQEIRARSGWTEASRGFVGDRLEELQPEVRRSGGRAPRRRLRRDRRGLYVSSTRRDEARSAPAQGSLRPKLHLRPRRQARPGVRRCAHAALGVRLLRRCAP